MSLLVLDELVFIVLAHLSIGFSVLMFNMFFLVFELIFVVDKLLLSSNEFLLLQLFTVIIIL